MTMCNKYLRMDISLGNVRVLVVQHLAVFYTAVSIMLRHLRVCNTDGHPRSRGVASSNALLVTSCGLQKSHPAN